METCALACTCRESLMANRGSRLASSRQLTSLASEAITLSTPRLVPAPRDTTCIHNENSTQHSIYAGCFRAATFVRNLRWQNSRALPRNQTFYSTTISLSPPETRASKFFTRKSSVYFMSANMSRNIAPRTHRCTANVIICVSSARFRFHF